MQRIPRLLGVVFLTSSLAGQEPRPPVQVEFGSSDAFDPAIATDGDRSAALWNDGVTADMLVATSDGRGTNWSAATKIDGDLTAARKDARADGIFVAGDAIYALWKDKRIGATNDELYFNRSLDGGATWLGEVRIDKGYAVGTGAVRDWAMAVSADVAGDHVYIGFTVDPDGISDEELYLVASHDGGATFAAPAEVSAVHGFVDVDEFGLAAIGNTVHVAWLDNRNGLDDDVFYQHSDDGALTWMVTDLQLDSSGAGNGDGEHGVQIALDGNTVAACWLEENQDPVNEELRIAVSVDAGQTWAADAKVGGYAPSTDDVDNADFAAAAGTIYATWEDNRSGTDECYVAYSTDSGVTWSEQKVSNGGGSFPRAVARDSVAAIAWSNGAVPNENQCVFTGDGGVTWIPPVVLSANTGDIDFVGLALNERYNNVLSIYVSDDLGVDNVYVGGVRTAGLRVNGPLTAGGSVSFDLDQFRPPSTHAAVLASAGTATGSYLLPFGDGRETGLLDDSVLQTALTHIPGLLSVQLNNGTATTTPLIWPGTLPIGTSVYFVGVGYTPAGPVLGDVTDVVVAIVS